MFAAKAENLGSNIRTHMVEGGNQLWKDDLWPLTIYMCIQWRASTSHPCRGMSIPLPPQKKKKEEKGKRKEAKKGMNWLKTNKIKDPWGREHCQIPEQSRVLPKNYRISEFVNTPSVCPVSQAWSFHCQSSLGGKNCHSFPHRTRWPRMTYPKPPS